MENNIREDEVEVKTVYVKEKQKTGWWKISMLVLTILITISFAATALFAGIGAWQLHKIEENQAAIELQAPQNTAPYYGNNGETGNSQYGGYYDGNDYGAGRDEEYNLDDILEYYGDDIDQFFHNKDSGSGWREELSDWFSGLFGGDDAASNQNSYGF